MGKIKPSNCKSCGAPLNWSLPRCEYCGVQFQEEQKINGFLCFYNQDYIDFHPHRQVIDVKKEIPKNLKLTDLLGAALSGAAGMVRLF